MSINLKAKLESLSSRINAIKDNVETEEATKQSMILPFFQSLGYDVFNPLEFIPEYTADVGIKKGEKVDYAILDDCQQPIILIEAKSCKEKLDKHDSQLFRYFGVSSAKFAILTNGLSYKFYTDLNEPNKMDLQPFLSFDIDSINDRDLNSIEQFVKSNLDVDSIMSVASELRDTELAKTAIKDLFENPSDEFIKMVLNSGVFEGQKNQKIIDKFKPIIKRAISQHINDKLSLKFKETLTSEDSNVFVEPVIEIEEEDSKIITTEEEIESYVIIKNILRKSLDVSRIVYRDTESYFGILIDDNNRRWVCRLKLDGKKHIMIRNDEGNAATRYDLESLDDLYSLEEQLLLAATRFQ
ncbi:MAG: type I restriction endonuclease [Cellulosilyticaceae bacterium]